MTIYEYLEITETKHKFKRDYIENPLKKTVIRKGGGLEYEKADDEDLKYLYIDLGLSLPKINKIIGHKMNDYMAKFKKREYMKTPKLSKDELVELYCNQRKSLRELSDMFGYVGTTPVEDWLKFYGIEQKSPRYIDNKISKENLYELYIEKNYSTNNIATMFNSTQRTISSKLKEYGIKKDLKSQQLSRFISSHTDLQNRVLLSRDEFEKFIIDNDIKTRVELGDKLDLKHSSINRHIQQFGLKKYFCKRFNSDESKWLDSIGIKNDDIHRQVRIQNYIVDGFDPKTNTIYEYLGDYWHGNPMKFNKDDLNKSVGKTFGELYDKTMNRISDLKSLGYNVIYVWENDFNPRKNNI